MKRDFWTILWLGAGLLMTGCQDFLTVEQKGKTTIPVFLSYPAGLEAGLVGAYNKMYAYVGNEMTKYGDVAGNMLSLRYTGSTTDMVSQYNYVSSAEEETGAVGYIWRRAYEALADANNVIEYQPSVLANYPQDATELQQILGQALTLRALCTFDLCRTYGQAYCYTADASHLGVPVLLRAAGPDDNPSRNTVAQCYRQVESDLQEAYRLLDGYTLGGGKCDIYHVSQEAVAALLARVYLYEQQWSEALTWAQRVADQRELSHGSEYLNMFHTFTTPGEALWRLSGQEQSGKLKPFYDQVALPADTLLGLFAPEDLRRELLYSNGQKYCNKYLVSNATDTKRDDPMVVRASEMYLTVAEAACELKRYDVARQYLEQLLARAVDDSYAMMVLDETADAQLLQLVLRERVKELCFEGHCLFDLTRRGQGLVREAATNAAIKRVDWPDDRFVLPIPQTEVNANENIK